MIWQILIGLTAFIVAGAIAYVVTRKARVGKLSSQYAGVYDTVCKVVPSVDQVTGRTGDRVLVQSTDPYESGIYVVDDTTAHRSSDLEKLEQVMVGATVTDVSTGTRWVLQLHSKDMTDKGLGVPLQFIPLKKMLFGHGPQGSVLSSNGKELEWKALQGATSKQAEKEITEVNLEAGSMKLHTIPLKESSSEESMSHLYIMVMKDGLLHCHDRFDVMHDSDRRVAVIGTSTLKAKGFRLDVCCADGSRRWWMRQDQLAITLNVSNDGDADLVCKVMLVTL